MPGMNVEWPSGLVARPLTDEDAPAWKALLDAAEQVDKTEENYAVEDLLEDLGLAGLDRARGTLGVWEGTRMVAAATVRAVQNAVSLDRVRGDGVIHPEWRRRGLGGRLVDWQLSAAQVLHANANPSVPGVLQLGGADGEPGFAALMAARSFEVERYFFDMTRSLTSAVPVPDVPVPDGLTLVPFAPAYDEATRHAHNEAFRDHWGYFEQDATYWRGRVADARAFRPGLSWLLVDGSDQRDGQSDDQGTVAAYVLGYEWEADTAATGVRDCYIGLVGTRRAYRGRGAAASLLAATLKVAAEQGFDTASLGVDSANGTGALGLYERLGFARTKCWVVHSRPLADQITASP